MKTTRRIPKMPDGPRPKPTPFQRRLAEIGDDVAARQLRQKERTVRAWRYGARFPRPYTARDIVRKWGLTWADIYGG